MQANTEDERKTFRWDLARGGLAGVVETGQVGFALVVAIGFFQAPDTVKGIIAASAPLGLLVTPLTLSWFSRTGAPAGKIASVVAFLAGILMLAGAFAGTLIGFLVPTCLSFAVAAQITPLLLHIWTCNYPSRKRGSHLSVAMMMTVFTAFFYSVIGGRVLDHDLDSYRWVMGIIGCCHLAMGFVVRQMPSTPLMSGASENPLRNLGYAVEDKVFGIMLLGWMFLGFGNLMVLPLRVEYLLNPDFGIEASKVTVMAVTIAIPAFFRFITSRIWGLLFDRIDFMILRMGLNAMIMISIILFLTTRQIWLIAISAAVLGTAMAGANISWSLWVTKFATPEKAPAYMSVHTFSTGIRGVLAPFLGFYLISGIGAKNTAYVGSLLVASSIGIVFWLYRTQRRKRGTRVAATG